MNENAIMEKVRNFILAMSLALATAAHGQLVTDPVGYVIQNITGTGGTTDMVENLTTVALVDGAVDAAEVATVIANRISVTGSPWSADEFNVPPGSHFVEVRGGSGAGLILDIIGTGASHIDVARVPAGLIAAGDRIMIRKNFTVGGLFGTAGESFYDPAGGDGFLRGTNPAACDNIILLNPATKAQRIFYLHGDTASAEWREVGVIGDASERAVPYPLGIMVVRRGATNLEFINVGHVPFYTEGGDYVAFLEVWPGENFISMPINNATLNSSGLFSATSPFSVTPGSDPTTSDVLILNSGPERFAPAYYRAGAGWRRVGVDGDAGTWPFPFHCSARYHREGIQGWVRFETGFRDVPASRARRTPDQASVVEGLRIASGAGGQLTLTWPSENGAQYRLQTRPAFGDSRWVDLPAIVTGDGTPTSIPHTAVAAGEQIQVLQTQGQ